MRVHLLLNKLRLFLLLIAFLSVSTAINGTAPRSTEQRYLRPRIVGGKEAKTGKYPYFGFWFGGECGCTLIHKDVFLTAAHCVTLSTGLGRITLHTEEQPNTFFVEKIQIHPNYNNNVEEPKWDFALLKISGFVPDYIAKPIPLNMDDTFLTTPAESAFLTTMGYGAVFEGSPDWSETLQEVTTAYIPTFPSCQRAYNSAIIDAEICAGNYFDGGQDACQGDSGGPLLWQEKNAVDDFNVPSPYSPVVLVGLVSWGTGCARPGLPGVYARVSSAIDWIHASICFHSNDPPVDTLCNITEFPLPITFRLQLQYDENAGPLSWGLYHIDTTTTIYQQSLGSGDRPPGQLSRISSIVQTEYVEDLTWMTLQFSDLEPGTYYFQIRDYSENAVKKIQLIELLGEENRFWINQEGSIGGFFSVYFDVVTTYLTLNDLLNELEDGFPQNDTLIEAPPSDRSDLTPLTKELTIEVFFDNAPTDISWKLSTEQVNTVDINGQEKPHQVIAYAPRYTVSERQLRSKTIQVEAPGVYEFQLLDEGKNGFSSGSGWVAIWVGKRLVYYAYDGGIEGGLHTKITVT